ncbi:MAG: DEAD/DEAH box helicase [Hydrogenophilales bacterium]|nr:DEAD/DEAH box helicase [Hydrogenophilales bacterium]
MSFSELGLDPLILKSVLAAGYENATPVQMQAIPAALSGRDLLVSSHTGSGKTAAFLLPSIQRLQTEPTVKSMGPRVLVLTPTRELALQVEKSAMTYGKDLRRFRTACLVGGAPYGLQLKRLSQPVDVVVATPGRLIDHLERGKIDFSRLEVLVLDEADRMLDMGFVDDIKAIAARCPAERQTLLFSATLDGVVGNLARELTRDAQRIEIEAVPHKESKIEQRLLFADNMDHKDVAARGIDVATISHVINFDLPRQAEDYVHRIGRTGRAGRTGIAVSFAGMREGGLVKNIERYTGNRIEVHTLPGLEPTQKPASGRPSSSGRPRSNNGPRGGFGDKRPDAQKRSFGDRNEARSYGDRPPRGDSRDNRDRGYRADARPGGDRFARSDAPRGNRFEQAAVRGPSDVPRMTGDRPSRNEGFRGADAPREPKGEVNGNSVEYWEKREREAKAKAAAAATRSYGNRAPGARAAQPRGNDSRGGANRVGVRGRFKD